MYNWDFKCSQLLVEGGDLLNGPSEKGSAGVGDGVAVTAILGAVPPNRDARGMREC